MAGKSSVYEQDFVRWAETQAETLRRAAEDGSNLPLDWYNLAEEIESLGRWQRRELRSRLATIIEHLLKLQFLKGEIDRALALEWPRTAEFVANLLIGRGEAGPDVRLKLGNTGYSVEQVLGDWLPESFACS